MTGNLIFKINRTAEQHAFIRAKDQKANFEAKPTFRLINPAKTYQKISTKKLKKTSINVKNNKAVTDWFAGL